MNLSDQCTRTPLDHVDGYCRAFGPRLVTGLFVHHDEGRDHAEILMDLGSHAAPGGEMCAIGEYIGMDGRSRGWDVMAGPDFRDPVVQGFDTPEEAARWARDFGYFPADFIIPRPVDGAERRPS